MLEEILIIILQVAEVILITIVLHRLLQEAQLTHLVEALARQDHLVQLQGLAAAEALVEAQEVLVEVLVVVVADKIKKI